MQKAYYRDWSAMKALPAAFVISRLAAPLSRFLANRRVNPNTITLWAALCGLAAVISVLAGAWGFAAVGLLAVILLDHCDGQVARATNRRTSLGGYLDAVADILIDTIFLGAVTAWGILNDPKVALLGLMALLTYSALEFVGRHGVSTTVLEALRAKDFTPSTGLPTIRGTRMIPIVPHRDLNVVVLAVGLLAGWLPLALAGLTVWWAAWTLLNIAWGSDRPKKTAGILANLMHEDNH